ncbi:MAG TPA: HAD-IC family P-type ATPase [Vulgatibacter sp.]|nr:HAD-IC family P-type ATPase [Vulgatibacter sp.]
MTVLPIDPLVHPARVSRHATASRRLRLEVPSLRGDPWLARRLERSLRALPGVVDARADPRSGRLLVRYERGAPLLEGLREEPEDPPPGRADHPAGDRRRPPWHSMAIDDVLVVLGTTSEGLPWREARARLRQVGRNATETAASRSPLSILGEQVANVPMALLLGSAGLSALLAEAVEATAILAVVGLNAAIGYRIERKNEDILSSWRKLEAGTVDVVRGGVRASVSALELVPGDVLVCAAGDTVPADARVIESKRLACDESALTGESEARPKAAAPVDARAPLAERSSMIFAGTTVVSGRARAVIVATGAATEAARVRALVEEEAAPRPPLTRRLESLGNRLAAASIVASAVSAAAGIARGHGAVRVVRDAVALGVAAIPEGLPLVATAALVRSMQRLQDHGMIVRRLAAAEALGTVTVICADKTGTLTRNEMRLEQLVLPGGPVDPRKVRADPERVLEDPATLLLAAGVLNSDVELVPRRGRAPGIAGSSTERALVEAGRRAGLDPERLFRAFPRLRLWERREDVLYVMSQHDGPSGRLAVVKGAPGQVLGLCDLDPRERGCLERENEALASEGLRVLAFAWRRRDDGEAQPTSGFEFLGFAGLRDPLREGAAEAIADARDAGIRTVILTGDQPRTAEAIARELGVGGGTLLARDLEELDPGELQRRLDRTAVLARVTPEDKLEVVRLLQRRGQIVAMAGDGINDAPALKAADVGVAVGANATDIARQVSDLVMAGEDLRSILVAVGEGRIVQDDIRRSLRFLGATNLSEMALVVGASIVGAPPPLSALDLLWINLLTDTLPALALALEPGDPEVLDRRPARPDEPLLGGPELRRTLRDGGILAAVGAVAMAASGRPMVFAALPAAQLGYALACRASRRERGVRPTREALEARAQADLRFAGMVGGAIGLHLFALTAPWTRRLLGLPRPSPRVLGAFAAGSALPWLLRGVPPARVIVCRGGAGRRSLPTPSSPA